MTKQEEMEGMPAASPTAYISGTVTLPEGTTDGWEPGTELKLTADVEVTKNGEMKAEERGLAHFVNLKIRKVNTIR